MGVRPSVAERGPPVFGAAVVEPPLPGWAGAVAAVRRSWRLARRSAAAEAQRFGEARFGVFFFTGP